MNKRILIIDDEEHIRRMMRLTLEAAGYEVSEAHDGVDGLRVFGHGSDWSLVVLDQRMPGLDGLETLRELKQKNSNARLVMATAYASVEPAVDAMKLGASDFVRKPMTPEIFRNAVAAALSRPHSETSELQQRRFVVGSPEGEKHQVVVEIQDERFAYVQRMTGRHLAPESSFWTTQARPLLSDFIWNEGKVPPMHRLVMKSLSPDKLPVGARWRA